MKALPTRGEKGSLPPLIRKMRLTEHIVKIRRIKVEQGVVEGSCQFCGEKTKRGFIGGWSDTFTQFQWMEDGNVVCEYCHHFLKNSEYRRNSWMVEGDEFQIFKRDRIIEILLREKKEPFFVFVTRQGRKHGWFLGMRRLNYSQERWWMVFEDKLIYVTSRELMKMVDVGRKLREEKVAKQEMMSGNYKVKTVKKVGIEVVRKAREFVNKPLWEVVVYEL